MKYTDDPQPQKLPGTYKDFVTRFPRLGQAHEDIAKACESYGPLDRKTCELIKLPCRSAPDRRPRRAATCAVRCNTARPSRRSSRRSCSRTTRAGSRAW